MSKSSIPVDRINALAEFEEFGISFEPAGDSEVRVCCPVHDDVNPSVNFNIEKNVWKCHAAECGATGDIVTYLAHHLKVERKAVLSKLAERYELGVRKVLDPELIERHHQRLIADDCGSMRKPLYQRGVTDDIIRKARLGFDGERIIIPVYDNGRNIINVRKYLPGAPGPKKMRNARGYSGVDLYLPEQLGFQVVWLCGGELKALVAASILNQERIGALAVTAGEGAWDPSLTPKFRGKSVFICMDVDPGGRAAARRLAAQLIYEAASVYIVHLPLDRTKYPKGDINDWVGQEGADISSFREAMGEAEKFHLEELDTETEIETVETTLSESTKTSNMGKRILFDAVVSAMDTTPYIVPSKVSCSCTRDQLNCTSCPVRAREPDADTGKVPLTIKGTAAGLLQMIGTSKRMQAEAIHEATNIPPCKVVTFTIQESFNVWDVRLTPQLKQGGDNKDHIVQPGYVVAKDPLDLNQPYIFGGKVYPHPRSQQAVLLLDHVQQSEDSLVAFHAEDVDLESLSTFRPAKWTVDSIEEKLQSHYEDVAANVTRIFQRQDLHLAIDLTFHSCLYFDFDGQQQNGWVNCLIAGDSSQGKSEASQRMIDHYKMGVRHDCKNASTAGLLGGLQQLGNRWFVSWGAIPLQDRRLVVMEEIKGAPVEALSSLTDMRSSGVAEITRIEKRRAHARTRLIMISNPRSDRPVQAFNFGCEIIKELIGAMEDVRRFDFAMILSASQIDPASINRLSTERPKVRQAATSELCQNRVLWAWTRESTQIKFDDAAITACLKEATSLCSKFTEALPLVDRGTMRYKLARLAVSLAVMTFSTGDSLQEVRVRECHVHYISRWLMKIYGEDSFGYADFTRAQVFASTVLDPEVVRRNLLDTKYPEDMVEHLLHSDDITAIDIADWGDLERDDANRLLSLLVRKHALFRKKRWYNKTADFITLLKQMKAEGIPKDKNPEGEF